MLKFQRTNKSQIVIQKPSCSVAVILSAPFPLSLKSFPHRRESESHFRATRFLNHPDPCIRRDDKLMGSCSIAFTLVPMLCVGTHYLWEKSQCSNSKGQTDLILQSRNTPHIAQRTLCAMSSPQGETFFASIRFYCCHPDPENSG
jgi:hypothetical protein